MAFSRTNFVVSAQHAAPQLGEFASADMFFSSFESTVITKNGPMALIADFLRSAREPKHRKDMQKLPAKFSAQKVTA